MNFVSQPWNLLLVSSAGRINRHQQNVIEYLRTENQVVVGGEGGFGRPAQSRMALGLRSHATGSVPADDDLVLRRAPTLVIVGHL